MLLFNDIKKVFFFLSIVFAFLLIIILFIFFSIALIPLFIIVFIFRRFLIKKIFEDRNSFKNNFYSKKEKKGYIDVEYKKEDEKDID